MVDDFQVKSKSNQNIQSIEDMKRVLENYPEFRHVSLTVGKHVTIMGELSRVIDERRLMKVSQVEQDLACQNDRSLAYSMVQELLEDPAVRCTAREKPKHLSEHALPWAEAAQLPAHTSAVTLE